MESQRRRRRKRGRTSLASWEPLKVAALADVYTVAVDCGFFFLSVFILLAFPCSCYSLFKYFLFVSLKPKLICVVEAGVNLKSCQGTFSSTALCFSHAISRKRHVY